MSLTIKKNFIFCIVIMQCIACNEKNNNVIADKGTTAELFSNAEQQSLLDNAADGLFKNNAAVKQVFTVAANSNVTVIAKGGFAVEVNTAKLCYEDGASLKTENIEVTIEELLNTEALLAANATTVSNGKMLISGGSYNVTIQQNNKPLKIKRNESLTIKVPKLKDKNMELFYGKKDDNGFVNWENTNQNFTEPVKIKKKIDKYIYDVQYKVGDSFGKRPATFAECFMIYRDSTMKARWAYTIANRQRFSEVQEIKYGLQPIHFPTKRFYDNVVKIDSVSISVRNCFGSKLTGTDYSRLSYMYLVKDTFPIYKTKKESHYYTSDEVLQYFEPVEIELLGWLNVDKFYNEPTSDSSTIVCNNGINLDNYKVYYKFLTLNSLLAENHYNVYNNKLSVTTKLPIQQKVEVIIVGTSNKKIYTGRTLITVQRINKIPIILQQMEKTIAIR